MAALILPKTPKARHALRMSEAVPYFMSHRVAAGKADETLRKDRTVLKMFTRMTGNLIVSNVDESHVQDFFIIRSDEGAGPNTHNADLRALRLFFKWAKDRDVHSGINPMVGEVKLRVPTKKHFYIPLERFADVLDGAANLRDRMVIAFGMYFWQRQGEIGFVRIEDVHLETWIDEKTGEPRRGGLVDVRIPKTKDIDQMEICTELYDELVGWFEYYKQDQGVDELDPKWFVCPQLRRGGSASETHLGRQLKNSRRLLPCDQLTRSYPSVKQALDTVGMDGPGEGGHTLRRSGARRKYFQLIDKGQAHEGAIRFIMAMLHHKSMEVTENYLGVDADRARRNGMIRGQRMYDLPSVPVEEAAPSNVVALADWRGRRTS